MEDFAIKAENVSKTFKLPHEKQSSIKSVFINAFRSKKGYEIQKALNDVSFEVKKGEFFGIVGRNGSGKSTLLKLLAGIYSPTSGEVHVRGSLTPFIELGVGFNPELTGRENVFLNGALLGFNRKEMQGMYNDIVDFAELKKFMDQKLKNYSSGMQVRLAFSIAIRAKSDILLLDEVLAVGDIAFQEKCFTYFNQLKKDKQTVILVTHDMGTIEKYCDTGILIDSGKIIYRGEPHLLAAEYMMLNSKKDRKLSGEETELKQGGYIVNAKINGEDRAFIKSNETMEIVINVKPKRSVKAFVGASFIRSDGVYVAFHSTKKDKTHELIAGKQCSFKYRLKAGQFMPGVYSVDAALYNQDNHYIDLKSNLANFAISGDDISRAGIIHLEGEWSFKNG